MHVPLWQGVLAGLGITLLATQKERNSTRLLSDRRFDLAGPPPTTPCPESGAPVDPQR